MTIFGRKNRVKKDKIYNMAEALKILKNPQYVDYTSVEVGQGMYRIVLIEESRKLEGNLRTGQSRRNDFINRMNGDGAYANINNHSYPKKTYNNYQNARGYTKNAMYR